MEFQPGRPFGAGNSVGARFPELQEPAPVPNLDSFVIEPNDDDEFNPSLDLYDKTDEELLRMLDQTGGGVPPIADGLRLQIEQELRERQFAKDLISGAGRCSHGDAVSGAGRCSHGDAAGELCGLRQRSV